MSDAFSPAGHPILLRTPRRLTPDTSWEQHIPFAMLLVDLMAPRLLVELGTHAGDSYCAFCQAVEELSLPARCFAVDTWEGDEHAGHYGPEVLLDFRRHHDAVYGRFSSLLQTTFDEAALGFDDGSIDLLHIDGLHTYKAVRHDFETWLPKLSDRAVVLFHDTNERGHGFGVWRFWAEVSARYPGWEFPHGHGLGVLSVGRDEPAGVAALRAAYAAQPEIRDLFFALGHRIALLRSAGIDRATIATLEGHIRTLQQSGAVQEEAIARLRQDLAMQSHALAEKDSGLAIQQEALAEKDRGLAIQQEALAEKDRGLADRQASIEALQRAVEARDEANLALAARAAELEGGLANQTAEAARAHAAAAGAREELERVRQGTGYRVLARTVREVDRLAPWSTRRRQVVLGGAALVRLIGSEGPVGVVKALPRVARWSPASLGGARPPTPAPPVARPDPGQPLALNDAYQLWMQAHVPAPSQLAAQRREARRLAYRPKISILVPVHNTRADWLREAILSVREQTYPHWELCLVDDGSTRAETRSVLRWAPTRRIKVARLKQSQGIAGATARALAMATGEFIAFLDHDDELKPNALFEVVSLLNRRRDLDFIYTDEDKRDPDRRLVDPFFKPDWSPDLVMTANYVTHLAVYRRSVLEAAGGLRAGYDGSQDHDLILRVMERTDRIAHIPLPLYTWRKVPGSAAGDARAKPWAAKAGARALSDALARRAQPGDVLPGLWIGSHRVRYRIAGQPSVGIIIPTRDRVDLLRRAVDSIQERSTWTNYELIVVDNDSRDPDTVEYLERLKGRVLSYPHPFNYAAMMNLAAHEARTDHLLFLNNDTEVTAPGWIEALLEYAQQPGVGAVGARLRYPSGAIQHEGIIMGLCRGTAGNVDHADYFSLGESVLNCTAVTAACMMTRTEVFDEMGGLDENLVVAFNDVDYCLRLREKGYRIVYTPYATLNHFESASRGSLHPPADEQFFRDRWGNPGEIVDPFYNPNFDIMQPFQIDIGAARPDPAR